MIAGLRCARSHSQADPNTGGHRRLCPGSWVPQKGRRRASRQDQEAIIRTETPRVAGPLHACRSRLVNAYLFSNSASQPMQSIGKTPVNLEGNCVCQMVRDWALTMSYFRFVGPLNGRGKGEIKEPIARLPLDTTGPRGHSIPKYGIGAFAQ